MIKGWCFTNLDNYEDVKWPIVFAAVPSPGDYVASKSGKELKVSRVTHTQKYVRVADITDIGLYEHKELEPFIVVELANW